MSSTGSLSNGFSQDSSGKITGVLSFFDDDLPVDDDDFDDELDDSPDFEDVFDDEAPELAPLDDDFDDDFGLMDL